MKLKIGTYIDGRDGALFNITAIAGKEVTYYWSFRASAPPRNVGTMELATAEDYFLEHKFTYSKNTAIRAYINLLPR